MWEDLKEAMIRKYVSSLPTPEIKERYPRRFSSHGSKEAKRVVQQQDHRSLIHQDQILPNQGHTVFYDQSQPYEVQKTMERKNFVSQDTLARHQKKTRQTDFSRKGQGSEVQKYTISTSLLRSKVVHDLSLRDKEILNPEEEEPSCQAHGQALIAFQKQLLIAMRELEDQMARLEERSNMSRRKTQGRGPPHGETRFGDAPEDGYVEPKPTDPSWITPHHISSTHKYLTHSYLDFKSVNEVKIYSFSGSSRPDDYLSWERTMDDGFSYHGVLKKEKLSHAIKQLTGSAYKWWKGVDGARWKSQNEAIKMWEDLKEAMIRKYVSSLPTQEIRERYPRRVSSHGSKEAKRVVPQQDHRSLIHQDQILPNQGHTVFYDQSQPYEVQKTMERKNFVSLDTLARHKEKSDKPIFQEKTKDVKTGPEVQKYTISTSLLRSKVDHDLKAMIRKYVSSLPTPEIRERYPRRFSSHGSKEAKRVVPQQGHKSLIHQVQIRPNQGHTVFYDQSQPYEVQKTMERKNFVSQDTLARHKKKSDKPIFQENAKGEQMKAICLLEVPRKEPDHKLSHEPPHKWKPKIEVRVVQMPRLKVRFSDLKIPKTLDYPDLKEAMIRKYVSSLPTPEIKERYPRRFSSHGSKEAKRVVQQQDHRSLIHQDQILPNQGHTVFYDQSQPYEVQKTMERKNFVSQDTLARHQKKTRQTDFSRKGQGGTNEIYMLTEVPRNEPDHKLSHEPPHKWKPKIELSVVQMPSLKEVLNDRDNFYGFYTQEGVQANCNRAKVFTEQEVMNFTSQRFLSPSISEYPTLEEDSSPMKNRPEAKPIIGFQKAQYQEKWPQILGVVINVPEPAKPTSSMESLQPIQLGSTQSYLWEPGDHLNQSGENIQTQPRPSEDIMHEPEEFYEFISCTSNHWIRRILIYSNLPYLEQTDINVQQLFSPQIRHEIRTYQAPRKIPRKLS
ncbi:hypothetical protein F2Q69_00033855 [Brassica cretica]|uniref:Retrotransposon gag domain-containing protein n=1 Tax=Brassica cretica TaxID=69181 RepID=A0A8S9SQI9_BRACR|nr:hypothetical protein F2Q69_00033855 [Brassica cretica]